MLIFIPFVKYIINPFSEVKNEDEIKKQLQKEKRPMFNTNDHIPLSVLFR